MKYVPILFSTPMVQAILDGRKTQTRRVVKPQPDEDGILRYIPTGQFMDTSERIYKPKADVGDIFWVRETWAEVGFMAGDEFANSEVIGYKTQDAVFYHDPQPLDTFAWNWDKIKWKPSIFMPKDVCRIFLEVTEVKVERLQDISEEDAIAEGISRIHVEIAPSPSNDMSGGFDYAWTDYINPGEYAGWRGDAGCFRNAVDSFETLWQSINGKYSWKANPWVWVYGFKVIDKPNDFI